MDGSGNITITAPKTFTINAKDVTINAGNSIDIKAQPAEEGGGEGVIEVNAKKSINATTDTEGISLTAEKTMSIESKSLDLSLKASTDASLDAADISVTGSGTLNMSSGDTNIM